VRHQTNDLLNSHNSATFLELTINHNVSFNNIELPQTYALESKEKDSEEKLSVARPSREIRCSLCTPLAMQICILWYIIGRYCVFVRKPFYKLSYEWTRPAAFRLKGNIFTSRCNFHASTMPARKKRM